MKGEKWKQFLKWWKGDSWGSLLFTLLVAFLVIQFIFFPLLSLVTGTSLPLVIVESCSMYHSTNLEDVMDNSIYADYNISLEDTSDWGFQWGMNKGDIILVVGADDVRVGDVVIFAGGAANPIIHRVIAVDAEKVTTKGDHNSGLLPTEIDVSRDKLIGKAVGGVPWVGWVKLVFFEFSRGAGEQGLCS